VTLQNFFVLTRYNRSNLYAAAVMDLGAELARARHAPPDPPALDPKKETP
jgi:membrane-bound lytic murein transglycosylase B